MRKPARLNVLITALLFAVALPAAARPSTQAGREPDHEALRQLKAVYEQAAREGRPDLLEPHLDAQFTGVMVTGEQVDSFASLDSYWQGIRELMGAGGTYQTEVHVAERAIIGGDLAVARGTTDDVVVTGGGDEYRFSSRWTAVCRKRDGQWKLLRLHGSIDPIGNPFVEAQFTAALVATGSIAGVIGLVVGALGYFAITRLRRSKRSE